MMTTDEQIHIELRRLSVNGLQGSSLRCSCGAVGRFGSITIIHTKDGMYKCCGHCGTATKYEVDD